MADPFQAEVMGIDGQTLSWEGPDGSRMNMQGAPREISPQFRLSQQAWSSGINQESKSLS